MIYVLKNNHMKKLLLLIIFSFFSTIFYAQNNWLLQFNHRQQTSLENISSPMIDNNNMVFQNSLTLYKNWTINDKISIQNGIGFSREHVWGMLIVNHCWSPVYNSQSFCTEILVGAKHYTVYSLETPIRINYRLNDDLSFAINNIPQFRFFQSADNNVESSFLFDIHAIEIYPEVIYHFNQYSFSLGFRALNLRKPDTIYLYDFDFLDAHPDFYQKQLHSNNPIRMTFGFGYEF